MKKHPSSRDYHLRELAVARSVDDARRSVPEIPDGCGRVLDIGCGAGQTLIACDLKGAQAFGLEVDVDALQLGRSLNPEIHFVCGSGESLPFATESYGMVFSRVALPYMRIPTALAEIHRVLRPGGRIWFTLHGLSMFSWRRAAHSPKTAVFDIYRLLNMATLELFGWQFRYPLRPSIIESYQTEAGMSRVLRKLGFDDIQVVMGSQFIMMARKKS